MSEKCKDCCERFVRITNGDRLRAMTDEELAHWIEDFDWDAWCPSDMPVDPETKECLAPVEGCWQCVSNWLRKEVES